MTERDTSHGLSDVDSQPSSLSKQNHQFERSEDSELVLAAANVPSSLQKLSMSDRNGKGQSKQSTEINRLSNGHDDWSVVNNPEFSVHSFHLPEDGLHPNITENNISDFDSETFMSNKTRKSHTLDEQSSNAMDSEFNTLWYVPSDRSLRALDQPNSLPDKLGRVVPVVSNSSINGHGSYESKATPKQKSDQEPEQTDLNVKTSLMSFWNNMKNGFTVQMKTTFKYDCPLWLLGCIYYCSKQDRDIQREEHELGNNFVTAMDHFKTDFASKIWFTYRKDFQCLPYSTLTTDMGWGCMLRTGQMLLAQALVVHLLQREWRYQIHKGHGDILHRRILQFFSDTDAPESSFSIHRLVKIGKKFGKMPGDWYGPSSVAHVMREAMVNCESHPLLSNLCLYVAQDCTIYIEDVLDLCTKRVNISPCAESPEATSNANTSSNVEHWRSVIILIPVRLGGVELNNVYSPCVRAVLSDPMCLGIIGGKPKHSLYFTGYQEDKLIYLDPHFCQDYVDCDDRNFSTDSFHCNSPRKMNITKMDPSCTIGFYCRTRKDFDTFVKEVQKIVAPPMEKMPYPMFVFQEGRSEDSINSDSSENKKDRILKVCHYDSEGRRRPPKTSDDFVFL